VARYRKIDTRIWNDAKFSALSERGKLVFFFILTHPNLTMLGAMRASVPGLAAELRMQPRAFTEAFSEVLSRGMVEHDEKASFLWLPNFLRYNSPENPNIVRSWPKVFDLLPECEMKQQLLKRLKASTEGLSEGFQEAFAEAFPKAMPNQEQEQEQEQERTASLRPEENESPRSRPDAFLTAWNENRGDLPRVLELGDDRRKKLQVRIRGGLTIERFTEAVKRCATTPFLAGKKSEWRADFDWLIANDSNLLKVMEGKYGDSTRPEPVPPSEPARGSDSNPLPPHRDTVITLESIRAKAGIQ
jgi:hypothetical protein